MVRISSKYGFAFLCMPKTASTSIEKVLFPYCDLVTIGDQPSLKHTTYRAYARFLEPYLFHYTGKKLETVCLMREPIDWLHSWYRYRKRAELIGSNKSTLNMSFDEFCIGYMNGRIKVGRQYGFLRDKEGNVGVDRLIRYEEMDKLKNYFKNKLGEELDIPKMNVSPKEDIELSGEIRKKLRNHLKKEYEIYDGIK